jgi:anti-anti-sigma factor
MSARAGCMVVALRGKLDVCTATDGLSALTALAADGARVVVDLAALACMDCCSLDEIMKVRVQARRAGGDLVLAGPQPTVLRMLDLRDVASRGLVSASVDENEVPVAEIAPCSSTSGTLTGSDVPRIS